MLMCMQTSRHVLFKYLGCGECFPNINNRGWISSCIKFGTIAVYDRLLSMSDPLLEVQAGWAALLSGGAFVSVHFEEEA